MQTPSREFLDEQARKRAAKEAAEREEAERMEAAFQRRKAKMFRCGGVAGRNAVWQYETARTRQPVVIQVYPDERPGVIGWYGSCTCTAYARCWHTRAAIERELDYLQDIVDRRGWGWERVEAIAPLIGLEPQNLGVPLEESEPSTESEPDARSEPLDRRAPGDTSEPFIARVPCSVSEPSGTGVPIRVSEPEQSGVPGRSSDAVPRGGQVTPRGNGVYTVTSASLPGVSYSVQVLDGRGVCDCLGDRTAGRCKHIELVLSIEEERE